MGYIDFHCDTLMKGFFNGLDDIYAMENSMVNIEKLVKGQNEAQFFAIFFPPRDAGKRRGEQGMELPPDPEYFAGMRQLLLSTIEKHPEVIAFTTNYEELLKHGKENKISAFLTMEDGRAVGGSMEQLEEFYRQGVRLISLTWNFENCFGFPNSPEPEKMKLGLKKFGKEAVLRMNELGMIVDVSHLSDGGFYDVAEISAKPFVASHSNARALSPHPRNLTDEMIRILGEKGGVAGLNFSGAFLQEDITCLESTVERMVEHVLYLMDKGGEDLIAVGTDFDGIGGQLEIGSPDQMEVLFAALQRRGLTGRQMDKFMWQNARRVIRETM